MAATSSELKGVVVDDGLKVPIGEICKDINDNLATITAVNIKNKEKVVEGGIYIADKDLNIIEPKIQEDKYKTPDFYYHASLEIKEAEVKQDDKEEDDGMLTIEGFASTEDLDRGNDITLAKSFKKTFSDFMKNPMLLFMHDMGMPIGKVIEAEIRDEKGFFVKAKISATEPIIQQKIKENILKAFSFGFRINDFEVIEKVVNGKTQFIRIIKDVELLEVSVVSIPMNKRALFSIAKGMAKGTDLVCETCDCKKETKCIDENKTAEVMIEVGIIEEEKAERVLSKKNKSVIVSAISALQKLIEVDQPSDTDDNDTEERSGHRDEDKPKPKKPKKNVEIIENKGNNSIDNICIDIETMILKKENVLTNLQNKLHELENNIK